MLLGDPPKPPKGSVTMSVLSHLEPKEVFYYFEEICGIPHGSGNTKRIADYCEQFAARRGLQHSRDAHDNVIIVKEAAAGYENAAPVVLQGHLDMVCEKAPGCHKDMETEGLELAEENGWVFARGTTLGGDDGIAVAMMLALLADETLPAPRLECIITSDEEIGMLGAAALQPTLVTGRSMINLDSEEEGVFTVSCAGGNRTRCRLPVERETVTGEGVTVTVAGLTGGHSGVEIDKGRANADMLLGRFTAAARQAVPCRVVSLSGGLKDNAIPTEAAAVLVTDGAEALSALAERWQEQLRREYAPAEPTLTIRVQPAGKKSYAAMTEDSAERVLCMLLAAPNGIQAMSGTLPGLVQTSLNLGILTTGEDAAELHFGVRSALASQKEMLTERLTALTRLLGGSVAVSGDYPAWEYREESPLRERMCEVYREQYGAEPQIAAIHAGLECGLLCEKLPGLDCVSTGPLLEEIHTPRERMSVESVGRVWRFVREVLRRSR